MSNFTDPDTIITPAWELEPMEDTLPASWRRPWTQPSRIKPAFPWALVFVVALMAVSVALGMLL